MTNTRTLRVCGALLLLWGASACSSDGTSGDNTTGKRITLKTRMTAGTEGTQPFTTGVGWSVKLSKLYISTGALYYFDGATIFSRTEPTPKPEQYDIRWTVHVFDDLFGVRTAHAHPGHYIPGTARGEMLTATSVDLAGKDATLPTGSGVTGITRSATFTFAAPATGPFAAELGSHVVVVEGTADKGGTQRIFRAEVDLPELLNANKEPAIVGCTFKEVDMQADGTVTVTIKPSLWFDQVEFDTIPVSTDGKAVLMDPSTLGRKELVLGMLASDGYVFSYQK